MQKHPIKCLLHNLSNGLKSQICITAGERSVACGTRTRVSAACKAELEMQKSPAFQAAGGMHGIPQATLRSPAVMQIWLFKPRKQQISVAQQALKSVEKSANSGVRYKKREIKGFLGCKNK